MNVEEIKKVKVVTRCIRRAGVRYEETGDVQIVRLRDKSGVETLQERPVREQVFLPAKYIEEEIEETVYQVNDGTDIHEFSDADSANNFVRGQ